MQAPDGRIPDPDTITESPAASADVSSTFGSGMRRSDVAPLSDEAPIANTDRIPEFPGYQVEFLIGRGGMGRVYCARDRQLGRRVAVKCLIDPDSDGTLRRFVDEAKAVSALRHSNIAQLYEFRADHDPPFLVMEYVAGGTLSGFLAGRVLAARPAAQIAAALARAIEYAHRQQIVHRDLKPGNVLLEAGGEDLDPAASARRDFDTTRLKIADFGLAKQLSAGSGLTQSGEIVGTAAYMSPEQAMGDVSRIGPATDVYSLGAILYEMLTGRPPFDAPEAVQTLMMLVADDVVAPRSLVKTIPIDLQTICLKCLEKKPSQRYPTAAALADDLERFLRDEPISARPISPVQKAIKWAKRRPWQATALGTIGVSLVGAAIGLWVLQGAYDETRTANDDLVRANDALTDANSALTEANRRTREAFDLTHESLDRIVDRVRNELYDVPGAAALTLRTVADSVDLRRKLVELQPDSPEAVRQLIGALDILRLTHWRNGDRVVSKVLTKQLEELVERSHAKFPDDVFLATERIKLALETIDEKETSRRTEIESRIAADVERLLTTHPAAPLVWRAASSYERRAADTAVAAADLPAVLKHAARRVAHCEEYLRLASPSEEPAARMWLIYARVSQADYQAAARDAAGMKTTLERAMADFGSLDSNAVPEEEYREIKARIYELIGKSARFDGDLPRAIEAFRSAAAELEWQRDRFPEATSTITSLAQVQLFVAESLAADRKPAEAVDWLARAEKSVEQALEAVPDDYLAGDVKRRIEKARASSDFKP